jgi:hypothetical protein
MKSLESVLLLLLFRDEVMQMLHNWPTLYSIGANKFHFKNG